MTDKELILSNLLGLKLQTLNVYATTGMTWWVSSIVFCGTIIAGTWVKREELERFPLLDLLGWFLAFFFTSIVLFGVWVITAIQQLRWEVNSILEQLSIAGELAEHFTFTTYQVAYGIGTTSFAIILLIWILLWKLISNEKRKIGSSPIIVKPLVPYPAFRSKTKYSAGSFQTNETLLHSI